MAINNRKVNKRDIETYNKVTGDVKCKNMLLLKLYIATTLWAFFNLDLS